MSHFEARAVLAVLQPYLFIMMFNFDLQHNVSNEIPWMVRPEAISFLQTRIAIPPYFSQSYGAYFKMT